MPRRVLTDEFDVTFTRDELMAALRMVRGEIQQIPPECNWTKTSVWASRKATLQSMEEKIVTSYNTSGTRVWEPKDDIETEAQLFARMQHDLGKKDNWQDGVEGLDGQPHQE